MQLTPKKRRKGEYAGTPVSTITNCEEKQVPNPILEGTLGNPVQGATTIVDVAEAIPSVHSKAATLAKAAELHANTRMQVPGRRVPTRSTHSATLLYFPTDEAYAAYAPIRVSR
jgi:hypothetical protein